MEEKFDKAIDNMLAMAARANCKPEDALRLSQSALNLAHARVTWMSDMNKRPSKPKGPDS